MEHELSDDDLMRLYARGNAAAGGVLFDRHSARLFGFLKPLVGNDCDAEDLLQETFIKMHGARASYTAQGRFVSWLYKIATNCAYSHLEKQDTRQMRNVVSLDDGSTEVQIAGPEKHNPRRILENREFAQAIEQAIARMPTRPRTVFLLRQMRKLSWSEIADIMNEPEGRLRTLFHRTRTGLYKELKSWMTND